MNDRHQPHVIPKPGRYLYQALALTMVMAATIALPVQADEIESTSERFSKAYQEEDWPAAIEAGLQLDKLRPDSLLVKYNLACVYALDGDPESSLAWLEKAAANGLRNPDKIEEDSDLDSIRELPAYAKVLEQVRVNREQKRVRIGKVFELLPPVVELPEGWDGTTPAPLLIILHGYGGRADNLPEAWRVAGGKAGAVVVAPWGQSPVGPGSSWSDLYEAETLVKLTIDWISSQYPIDEKRMVLTGFSQGGYMSYAIGVRNPELFTGVIPMGSGYRRDLDQPPAAPDNAPRYYFMIGSNDRNVRECRAGAKDFEEAGYEVGMRVYPRSGHSFPVIGKDRELTKALQFALDER